MSSSLFPLNVVQLDPPTLTTADCDHYGKADDGMDYAIKTANGKNPKAPAAEWCCHELATACGIAVPTFAILQMPDKTEAFGSRWEGGVTQDTQIITQILTGGLPSNSLAARLSAIFAFDLFVFNDDRHTNNYLFRTGWGSDYSVLAYDFSRAWTYHSWPLPKGALPTGCQTMKYYRAIQKHQPFDSKAAHAVLKTLRELPVRVIQDSVNKMPSSWLDKKVKNAIVKWWGSKDRAERIDFLKKGISDGTLL